MRTALWSIAAAAALLYLLQRRRKAAHPAYEDKAPAPRRRPELERAMATALALRGLGMSG